MGRKKDLTGCMFGTLLVLKRSENKDPKKKHALWIAECKNCNSIREYIAPELGGTRISCGCIGNVAGKDSPYWKGCGDLSKTKFKRIKEIAERRKIEFTVEMEYLWDLLLKQNKKCAYSGIELVFGVNTKDLKSATASLDRIDSSLGYIEGNVQWVLKDINMMKQQLSHARFLELCKIIVENNKNV